MTTRAWSYFNGTLHGWNASDGYHPPKPTTAAYCWDCGPDHIPGFDKLTRRAAGHFGTGFKCSPWRIGRPCGNCGKVI